MDCRAFVPHAVRSAGCDPSGRAGRQEPEFRRLEDVALAGNLQEHRAFPAVVHGLKSRAGRVLRAGLSLPDAVERAGDRPASAAPAWEAADFPDAVSPARSAASSFVLRE